MTEKLPQHTVDRHMELYDITGSHIRDIERFIEEHPEDVHDELLEELWQLQEEHEYYKNMLDGRGDD